MPITMATTTARWSILSSIIIAMSVLNRLGRKVLTIVSWIKLLLNIYHRIDIITINEL